ncbi:MAG: M1 family aminopeptidase, partial [Eudoraea sp.]|nr:M1 family aminopeptidase [Eudoraea sp.]
KDSSWILVNHNGDNGPLVIEYLLKQDFSLQEQPRECYRPIIQPEYFHLFSHNFFMVPDSWESDSEATRQVSLSWEGFPEDYVIHNSFGSRERVQQLNDISLEKFHMAVFVGGDFRLMEDDIKGNRVVLAVRGDWIPFTENEVFGVLMETLEAQRNFWDDHSQEFFTVTLRPMAIERGSAFQGSGLTNSFACQISNNKYTDISQLIYLFNHELQHNWTGSAIKNDNEEEQYWFSEGFTDYYTAKNISKYEIGGTERMFFIKQLNETIRNLYSSPVVDAPNSEINYDNFWVNQDYGKLAYYRGAVYAFLLDNFIYKESSGEKTLDQLMQGILKDAVNEGQKVSHSYWLSELESFLGSGAGPFFEDHIVQGKPFPLEELFEKFGYEFDTNSPAFDMGFEFTSDRRSVKAINEDSEAYKSGLREGDQFVDFSFEYGDIENPISLEIKRGDENITLSFLPVKQLPIPRLLENPANLEKISLLQ